MLSEVKQRQVSNDTTCSWNLKYDTNGLIFKTETDSQTQKTNCGYQREKGRKDKSRVWD